MSKNSVAPKTVSESPSVKLATFMNAEIRITELADDGRLETQVYSSQELDRTLDDAAEGGDWSPSYNRLQHAVLNAWEAARSARPSVRCIELIFPEESN